MKYANYQNTLSLHMIYTGHCEVGKEWCYRNIISPFTRLYLIDKGTANVYMNQKKYELSEGDMFIIPKFTFHTYECIEYMSHYYICFLDQLIGGKNLFEYADILYKVRATTLDECLMKRFLELNPNCYITNPDPKAYDNRPELFTINRENIHQEFKSDLESNGILLQLFSKFIGTSSQPIANAKNPYKRMIKVFNYINNNLSKNIHVAELSEIMCMTPDHFTRIFKNLNGMTPNQYLQFKRIERAQTLMLSSGMNIKEIAEEIGIPNLSQFSKLFHKQTGMSPSCYLRKQNS